MYIILVIFVITIAFMLLYSAAVRFYGSAFISEEKIESSGSVGIIGTTIVPILNIQNDLVGDYLLTSPHCFLLYDEELKRYYPGILDVGKMNAERLDSCVKFLPEKLSLKLSYDGKVLTLGAGEKSLGRYYVLVADGEQRYSGSLEVLQ